VKDLVVFFGIGGFFEEILDRGTEWCEGVRMQLAPLGRFVDWLEEGGKMIEENWINGSRNFEFVSGQG
jgi:hypothetical protein